MGEMKQVAKGDNNSQQSVVVNGNLTLGMNREEVYEMIKSYNIVNREEIIGIVKEAIDGIKEEDRIFPDKRIFVPTIQQLSYSMQDQIIKNTYNKLLNSSMDRTKSNIVHPSFINIISQLNSDEIKILNKVPPVVFALKPLINLNIKIGGKSKITLLSNFSDIAFEECDFPQNIGFYIENLERLKLIEIPPLSRIVREEEYERLERHPMVLKIMEINRIKDDRIEQRYEFDKKLFHITEIGINFLKACIK